MFSKNGFICLVSLLLLGCSLLGVEEAPYLLSSLKVVNGGNSDHHVGAVEFDLVNQTAKDVAAITVEFDVYDTEGNQQPGIGDNHVESTLSESISAQGISSIMIVLDPLFTFVPAETLTVTRFCITKIVYTDGSSWKDIYKTNLIMSDSIEVETL